MVFADLRDLLVPNRQEEREACPEGLPGVPAGGLHVDAAGGAVAADDQVRRLVAVDRPVRLDPADGLPERVLAMAVCLVGRKVPVSVNAVMQIVVEQRPALFASPSE